LSSHTDRILLRHAVAADFPAVATLVNAAYRGISSPAGWTAETELLGGPRSTEIDLQREVEANATTRILVAEDDGRLVGCIALKPLTEMVWYFSMLGVHPAVQSRQVGRAILAEAERIAADEGADTMRMTVISVRTSLIDWYGRRGYVATGEILPFPYDDPSVGRPLRAGLTLSVFEKPLARTN
jgi:N-acetylglutamate synthase-like GNAT family acetyltransferase